MKPYRLLTDFLAPLINLYLRIRQQRGREDQDRFQERLGIASLPRPAGKLVWCHAASVGEMMSVMTLLQALRARHEEWTILLTTGTVTSAQLIAKRLPEGVLHQYVPVDRWSYVTHFLDHWQPDLALWIESELWPNMLTALKKRNVPAALLNGRMSERSYRRWRFIKNGAEKMLSVFSLGLAQTGTEANRFASLGLKNVSAIGNLKYAATPLPCDENALLKLRTEIGERPVWLMASTHSGEEEIALRVHAKLARKRKNLLTIIVPRHPERGHEIAKIITKTGLSFAQRSKKEEITSATSLYLADTMGELGLFYRLTKTVCLAGSFTWGGHNPIEPVQLGCAVIFGPRMDNFSVMADDILGHRAAQQVDNEEELIEALETHMEHPEESRRLIEAAKPWLKEKQSVLEETLLLLDPFFMTAKKAKA
ncbi:MAG TPA: 3-deoxy-D-manno-octulosonic acid transferase [Rhodospirillaceae bacterium]|nr:3-deoxy-D-manno-octulosonic acid transferase [Rhodospirillaceae bacterium]